MGLAHQRSERFVEVVGLEVVEDGFVQLVLLSLGEDATAGTGGAVEAAHLDETKLGNWKNAVEQREGFWLVAIVLALLLLLLLLLLLVLLLNAIDTIRCVRRDLRALDLLSCASSSLAKWNRRLRFLRASARIRRHRDAVATAIYGRGCRGDKQQLQVVLMLLVVDQKERVLRMPHLCVGDNCMCGRYGRITNSTFPELQYGALTSVKIQHSSCLPGWWCSALAGAK